MNSLKDLLQRFKPKPMDLVGLDINPTGIAAVRMRKNNEGISVLAADVLPPPAPPPAGSAPAERTPLALPAPFRSRYASLAVPADKAVIRLLTFSGRQDTGLDARIVENMGLDDPNRYRISYKLLTEGHGRADTKVLGAAIPEAEAAAAVAQLATGLPVPFSLEVSALATMTAFLDGPAALHKGEAIGVLEFSPRTSLLALFRDSALVLIRRFDRGTEDVLERVCETLGVDRRIAGEIMADGSFDISHTIVEVMEPLIKQLIITRAYVERRENCRLRRIYLNGGLASSRNVHSEIKTVLEVETEAWNPFGKLKVLPNAVPQTYAGREWIFSAAVGAGLGTFEET